MLLFSRLCRADNSPYINDINFMHCRASILASGVSVEYSRRCCVFFCIWSMTSMKWKHLIRSSWKNAPIRYYRFLLLHIQLVDLLLFYRTLSDIINTYLINARLMLLLPSVMLYLDVITLLYWSLENFNEYLSIEKTCYIITSLHHACLHSMHE